MLEQTRKILPILLISLGISACQPRQEVKTGQVAPKTVLLDLANQERKLTDYRGDVLFVNFWWAGCGPCLREMPELDEVYQAHKSEGFKVLGVNMGQTSSVIRNVNRRIGVTFPLFVDELKITSQQYGVKFAPTSFLINREGVIVEKIMGPVSKDELEEKISHLL